MEKRNKSLESTYKQYDTDMNSFYNVDIMPVNLNALSPTNNNPSTGPSPQLKHDKEEYEDALLKKFREYILSENLQIQKQARYDILTKALGDFSSDLPGRLSSVSDNGSQVPRKTIKLFGTGLKEHIEESSQPIPDIVESCVKYIAKYGRELLWFASLFFS